MIHLGGPTFVLGLALVCSAVASPARLARAGGKGVEGVVNLNTAGPELLSALPGIGPAKAQGIVAYRTRHPFRTVDELVRVKGIGRRMVRALRSHLAIAGPSTARPASGSERRTEAAPPPAPLSLHPAPRPLCRPVAPLASSPSAARAARAAQNRSSRARANHCAPSA